MCYWKKDAEFSFRGSQEDQGHGVNGLWLLVESDSSWTLKCFSSKSALLFTCTSALPCLILKVMVTYFSEHLETRFRRKCSGGFLSNKVQHGASKKSLDFGGHWVLLSFFCEFWIALREFCQTLHMCLLVLNEDLFGLKSKVIWHHAHRLPVNILSKK